MIAKRLLPLSLLLLTALCAAQPPAPSPEPESAPPSTGPSPLPPSFGGIEKEKLPPAELARRNALLKPGLARLKAGDKTGAFAAFQPALIAFPDDLRVLRYAAEAAFFSDHNEEALDLFTRALAQNPYEPWPLRLALLQTEARLARWDDFDRDLSALRAAKKAYTDHQLDSSSGFLIDAFQAGSAELPIPIQVIVFPLQADPYHTLFRFLLPKQSSAKTSVQTGIQAGVNSDQGEDRCRNPNFRPYIDLESDDIDQTAFKQAHPDLAANGERSYSLDTYSAPCSQGLIKFFNAGEPRYQTVREDVMKSLSAAAPISGHP